MEAGSLLHQLNKVCVQTNRLLRAPGLKLKDGQMVQMVQKIHPSSAGVTALCTHNKTQLQLAIQSWLTSKEKQLATGKQPATGDRGSLPFKIVARAIDHATKLDRAFSRLLRRYLHVLKAVARLCGNVDAPVPPSEKMGVEEGKAREA